MAGKHCSIDFFFIFFRHDSRYQRYSYAFRIHRPKKQHLEYKKEIDTALSDSLNSSSFILGKQVSLLEEKLAEYVGCNYCLSVANGTDALHIAELALGINGDDNIILPSFTWVSMAETIKKVMKTY